MKIAFSQKTEDTKTISHLLSKNNLSFAPKDHHKSFSFVIKNKGAVIGGLAGGTYWNWLHIDSLYLPPNLRGQAIGTELVRRAEEYAKKSGCEYAHLDTHSFQSPGFYKKLGYKVAGKLPNLPSGHTRFLMMKVL